MVSFGHLREPSIQNNLVVVHNVLHMSLKIENLILKCVNKDQINTLCHAVLKSVIMHYEHQCVFTCEPIDLQLITYLISNMAY